MELSGIEEAHSIFSTFSDWLSTAQKKFSSAAISIDAIDCVAMEKKIKKLEVQQQDYFFFYPLVLYLADNRNFCISLYMFLITVTLYSDDTGSAGGHGAGA